MKLLDSNIIIYSPYPEYSYLRDLVDNESNCVSAVTVVEVLGFHRLQPDEKEYYESVFEVLQVLDVSSDIISKAVEIRQKENIKLGDAIIAATALVYDIELNTRNIKDFQAIKNIKLNNPIK